MDELTTEDLEREIFLLAHNIEVHKALGGDVREAQLRLAAFRSQLFALIQSIDNTKLP